VTAPWILISAAVVILMYVVALAYTSTNAGSQPPPIGAFGLDDHMGDTGSADPLPAKWTTDNFEDEFNYHARKKPIERDTPLGEAFGYMALREWGHDTDRALMELCEQRAPNIFSQFRQRAFDGEITVWGRRHRHDIYVPIEPRYWHTHQIDGGALLNGLTRTWGQDGESYIDLMVSRAQIERAWK
jgi:hypothetical protein